MKKYDLNEVLSLSLDIGEAMLKCGAEISRVEDTIDRICSGYGVFFKEVFAMNSLIVLTLRKNDETVTESRRILYHKTNLDYLEKLNELSREICKNNISREDVLKKINSIKDNEKLIYSYFGKIIAASFFTLFFGGNLKDFISAIIIASLIHILDAVTKKSNINNLIYSFLCSFLMGFVAILFTRFNICNNFDKVVIGNIMLLIPGLSMFISINDIFKGDTMSGLGRFTEGLFLALCISAGVGFSLLLFGGLL